MWAINFNEVDFGEADAFVAPKVVGVHGARRPDGGQGWGWDIEKESRPRRDRTAGDENGGCSAAADTTHTRGKRTGLHSDQNPI